MLLGKCYNDDYMLPIHSPTGVQTMLMVASQLKINSQRLRDNFDALANIGATLGGGVSRIALSTEDLQARAWFANRTDELGLLLRDDEAGNISALLACPDPDAPTLLVGSHLDSCNNGGKYDGSVGVLAGLECAQTLKDAGVVLPFHLEVINFTDEEGSWQSLFGSMALAGVLRPEHINDTVQDNAPFRAALWRAGLKPEDTFKAKRDFGKILGYMELHIEQSDRLMRTNTDIGIVTHIMGRISYRATFYGEAVHAATNADRKRDALQGAASYIAAIHTLPEAFAGSTVNCGHVNVMPGNFTIVPSQVTVSLEARHSNDETLMELEKRVIELAFQCAEQYHLRVRTERVLHRPVATMSDSMCQHVEQSCQRLGLSHTRLVSLAGHDAQILAPFTPTTMIFIPCNGISMNPREYTEWHHVEHGANTLLHAILDIANAP